MAIQISGCNVIDNSRNLTNIANATTAATANTYVLRGASGKICADSILPFLGASFGGGFLICNSSSVHWIVAPSTSEVSTCWSDRNDAVAVAQIVSGCTGWFVPTCGQLQNPGYSCRSYWDSYSSACYWSSTEYTGIYAWLVCFNSGNANIGPKSCSLCVRAFRCVTY